MTTTTTLVLDNASRSLRVTVYNGISGDIEITELNKPDTRCVMQLSANQIVELYEFLRYALGHTLQVRE